MYAILLSLLLAHVALADSVKEHDAADIVVEKFQVLAKINIGLDRFDKQTSKLATLTVDVEKMFREQAIDAEQYKDQLAGFTHHLIRIKQAQTNLEKCKDMLLNKGAPLKHIEPILDAIFVNWRATEVDGDALTAAINEAMMNSGSPD